MRLGGVGSAHRGVMSHRLWLGVYGGGGVGVGAA